MAENYTVKTAYTASNPDPIAFSVGEQLSVEDRQSDWEGWTWCRNQAGRGGWVPDTYISRLGSAAFALQDYDAVELSVDPGEFLTGSIKESGWLWCTKPSGLSGWVPCENLEKTA